MSFDVHPGLLHPGEQLPLVAVAPAADLLALEVAPAAVMFLSLNEIWVVALRSKICATSVILAPFSIEPSTFGHPGDRVVDVTGRQHVLRHDVRPALDDLHVQALVLVVALVDRGVVAGELRLGHPLQLQLDLSAPPPEPPRCRWPPVRAAAAAAASASTLAASVSRASFGPLCPSHSSRLCRCPW